MRLDPRRTLKKCQTARIESFLHWYLKQNNVEKTSALETYWKQLSQLHVKWTGKRIRPQTLRRVHVVRSLVAPPSESVRLGALCWDEVVAYGSDSLSAATSLKSMA